MASRQFAIKLEFTRATGADKVDENEGSTKDEFPTGLCNLATTRDPQIFHTFSIKIKHRLSFSKVEMNTLRGVRVA